MFSQTLLDDSRAYGSAPPHARAARAAARAAVTAARAQGHARQSGRRAGWSVASDLWQWRARGGGRGDALETPAPTAPVHAHARQPRPPVHRSRFSAVVNRRARLFMSSASRTCAWTLFYMSNNLVDLQGGAMRLQPARRRRRRVPRGVARVDYVAVLLVARATLGFE